MSDVAHPTPPRVRRILTSAPAVLLALLMLPSCDSDTDQQVSANVQGSSDVPASSTGTPATDTLGTLAETAGGGDDVPPITEFTDAVITASHARPCAVGDQPAAGAFDMTTGALLWSVCMPELVYRTVVGATEDAVYVMEQGDDRDSTLRALDATDGTELWQLSVSMSLGVPPGPVAAQGVVAVETDQEGPLFLIGLDALTGEERWRQPAGDSSVANTESVVVTSSSSGIRGIDRATGDEVWTSDVRFDDQTGVGVARGAAAVTGEVVAVPSGDRLVAIDATSGQTLWETTRLDHPSAADGVIVGGDPPAPASPATQMRAVDAVTGENLWTAAADPSYGDLWAVGDGAAFVLVQSDLGEPDLGQRVVVALDLRSGAERWRPTQPVPAEPQQVAGTSLIMLWEGILAVVSTVDGSTTWLASEPLRSTLMSSVGANSSTVFVVANSLPFGD